ncbi:unnamed protein product [Prorocentrum cordatum]|uniref:Glycosyl transferase CAP10 domain-containing protein n=1 Tax=Prorocentrum cordatum TaxID=2364126 RepID=A0ABN9QZ33_9DINO|nr:unnamed protein product [Polarella glacialis]
MFDLAFLEDDLLNSTVVGSDENFVPLDRWPEWRYLLDLPGNGYSGSLKQKLTSSSAVFLLSDVGVPGASPVYEHYHAGLQHGVQVLRISVEDAGEKLQWARNHDSEVQNLVRRANEYMEGFEERTQCYLWKLLDGYGRLLRYQPSVDQNMLFGGEAASIRSLRVQRRPLREESAKFIARCSEMIEEYSQ